MRWADATHGGPVAAGGAFIDSRTATSGAVGDGDQPAMWSIEVEDHEEHHRDETGGEQGHEHAAFVRGEEHAEDTERECAGEELQPEHW